MNRQASASFFEKKETKKFLLAGGGGDADATPRRFSSLRAQRSNPSFATRRKFYTRFQICQTASSRVAASKMDCFAALAMTRGRWLDGARP
jgi:hypothetical protein